MITNSSQPVEAAVKQIDTQEQRDEEGGVAIGNIVIYPAIRHVQTLLLITHIEVPLSGSENR